LTAEILSAFKNEKKLKELAIELLIFGAASSNDYIRTGQINEALRVLSESEGEISEAYRTKIMLHFERLNRENEKRPFTLPGGTA